MGEFLFKLHLVLYAKRHRLFNRATTNRMAKRGHVLAYRHER